MKKNDRMALVLIWGLLLIVMGFSGLNGEIALVIVFGVLMLNTVMLIIASVLVEMLKRIGE
jgi:succinate-acetate transporter protein